MRTFLYVVLLATALLLPFNAWAAWKKLPADAKPFAQANLEPKSGTEVGGTVDFIKLTDGILVRVAAKNLAKGDHGFHIHEVGDCSAPNASSAGEHFNPTKDQHGGVTSGHRHVGDLGNLTVGGDGQAEIRVASAKPKEPGIWDSIVGKSIVIHAGKDDLKSNPAGNSGDRIACGVIKAAP